MNKGVAQKRRQNRSGQKHCTRIIKFQLYFFAINQSINQSIKMPIFHDQLLSLADFQQAILDNTGVLLVKFTATWCKPCRNLAPLLDPILERYAIAGVTVHVIDVDACEKLYSALSTKKRVKGIPALMCFLAPNQTIYPDDMVVGSDPANINRLLYLVQDYLEKNRFVAAASSTTTSSIQFDTPFTSTNPP